MAVCGARTATDAGRSVLDDLHVKRESSFVGWGVSRMGECFARGYLRRYPGDMDEDLYANLVEWRCSQGWFPTRRTLCIGSRCCLVLSEWKRC
jgi:hypothetical protein